MTADPVRLAEPLFAEGLRLGLLPPLDRALVLDTEFMTVPGIGRRIFALGLGHVREGHCGALVLFPEAAAPLVEVALHLLEGAVRDRLPVLTWCGTTADLAPADCLIPGIDWTRWRRALAPYHLDLYRVVRRHVPLGCSRWGLKNVAAALGIARASRLRSGWAAPRLYARSLRTVFPEGTWERRALRQYLADDVRLVYEVARAVERRLAVEEGRESCSAR